jgi:hypothetical protein
MIGDPFYQISLLSLFLTEFTSEMAAIVSSPFEKFTEQKYQTSIVGTLVLQGLHQCKTVTVELLNQAAKALRQTFRDTFGEVWSFVIFNRWSNYSGWVGGGLTVTLGTEMYHVHGVKYVNSASELQWPDKFNAYFIKEFACQQWVTKCEPIRDSLRLKYKDEFGGDPCIVVVRGGTIGGDVIGKSFFHCGFSVWVIAG